MSRQAFWSLMGMYNHDDTLLDNMHYPEEFTAQDRESFKYELFTETAEMEVLYNDPSIMKILIGHWSHHRKPIWDHLIDTTQYEYDPIANWDKHETITETREGSNTSSTTASSDATIVDDGSDVLTNNLTHTEDDTVTRTLDTEKGISNLRTDNLSETVNRTVTNSGTDTTTNSVNGFEGSATNTVVVHDISALQHGAKAVESATTTNSGTQGNAGTETEEGTITDTYDREARDTGTASRMLDNTRTDNRESNSETTGSNEETFSRTYVGKGNIGTMTSQDMIKQEREIAMMDIIDIMIKDFKKRFLIQIY